MATIKADEVIAMELSSVLGGFCNHGNADNPDRKTFFFFAFDLSLSAAPPKDRTSPCGNHTAKCIFGMREIKSSGVDASAHAVPASAASEAPGSPHPCNAEVCV